MKLDDFRRIKRTQFRVLKRFLVEKAPISGGGVDCNVEVIVIESLNEQGAKLCMKFTGCTDLEVGNFNVTACPLIAVYDISDHGLEGISYRVVEEENAYFSLNCRDFDFHIQNPTSF